METEEFKLLKILAESHGLKQVPGLLLNSIRFEKPGVSIETTDFSNFTIVHTTEHGSTQRECTSFTEAAEYLGSLHV